MNFDKLKNLMDNLVAWGLAPGNSITVHYRGEKVFEYSSGVSDIENGKKMVGDEYFRLYSCSKITTVVAALQLVENGTILLNDPLYDYIPEFKDKYIKREDGELVKAKRDITIKNLFNMTAGLKYEKDTPGIRRARELTGGKMDTDVVARCMGSDPIYFEPGDRFHYSMCHDVLAGLVSIVTGKKFRDYVKENVFDPLGMSSCTYHYTQDLEPKMATQYRFDADEGNISDMVEAQKYGRYKSGKFVRVGFKTPFEMGEEYDSGGAGIISTVSDYAKLAAALANHGMGLTGERILSAGGVELLRTNTLDAHQIRTFDWPQLAGYGYGLGVRTLIDKAAGGSVGNLGEFGWGGAAGASVYVDPDIGLSAVYAKHVLNPREEYYQPRVRNAIYACI